MEILSCENLSFTYPLCTRPALSNVSFSVNAGDFVVICGATGSGKSTLLRMLKRELTPLGNKSGRVFYDGTELQELSPFTAATEIGFVMQRPEQQIVTDKVWHELSFGLENMNVERSAIRRRVAEMACYFGIEGWFERDCSELSGGQKQLLNLASVMVMQPKVLILDEPTAQLDPIAATDFLNTLHKLNRELSLTVILVEHRLEGAIPMCDRLMFLENGSLLCYDEKMAAIRSLKPSSPLFEGMPAATRLYASLKQCDYSQNTALPLSVRDGRRFIQKSYSNKKKPLPSPEYKHSDVRALEFRDVYFRYEREAPDVLRDASFTVYESELFCILGGNGSGKTTSLGVAAGILRNTAGNVRVFGRKLRDCRSAIAYLPQDVQTVFTKNTVREELSGCEHALPYDASPLFDKHPYDLSGGEQQLVALSKVLSIRPKLLLLDEPTKGLDAAAKALLAGVLLQLKASGMTLVCVTHDVEFAATVADRCAMFFRGEITATDVPSRFFTDNNFYTTAVAQMTKDYYSGAITVDDAARLCRMNEECDRQ